ncbi:MAG: hypothetical protein HY074_09380 [Deltaproteobacteria bacterium]|nr:hypothetical protein [Deltaproteobacteria bacterium]
MIALSTLLAASAAEKGKPNIQRHYDKAGNLTEVVFYDYSVEPVQVERLTIEKDSRVRTTQRGRLLLRRETEKYSAPGVLSDREIEWCSEGNGNIDRKTVMHYVNFKIDVVEYALREGEWKLISTTPASGL